MRAKAEGMKTFDSAEKLVDDLAGVVSATETVLIIGVSMSRAPPFRRSLNRKYVWMGREFGGQRPMVFPAQNLFAVFTGWEIPNTRPRPST